MSTFKEVFPDRHTFLPVIHVTGGEQALRNVKIANENGADGVFLINHEIPYSSLFEVYAAVRSKFPNFWIGLNCLDLGGEAPVFIPSSVNGLWIDNAGISENGNSPGAIQISQHIKVRGWDGLYFGGVAFKGQAEVSDFAKAASRAVQFMDVVTTSGPATGIAANIGKLALMKSAIAPRPLAIASGTTPENVVMHMPYIDCFLVNTGISDSFTEFNPEKVRAFAAALGKK